MRMRDMMRAGAAGWLIQIKFRRANERSARQRSRAALVVALGLIASATR
jgi:hypothetical protein